MMMNDDKKRSTVIVASMSKKPKEASEAPEAPEVDSSAGHVAAAEEILSAVASKDAASLKNALKSFYDMCASEDYESPEAPEAD